MPIAQATEHFERLWKNPHSWHFADAAKMFKIPYQQTQSTEELASFFHQMQNTSIMIEWVSP
ncbi:MAG TPA: hypothetical protein DCE71_00750 [Parachlamydiales bacterium]|nr:hypothetical protein [Parachlamydiales bacterium]